MNAYEFMIKVPPLTITIAFLLCFVVIRCWSRFLRHLSIRKHGWPPAHCDADGDFRVEVKV